MTGRQRLIYGNVRNDRLIDNLPEGCCVEVPVVVDKGGLQPVRIGAQPPQLAGYCAPHTYSQDLVVRAAIEEDPTHLYQAALLDPQIATALTLAEIRRLVDTMLAAHADALPKALRPLSTRSIGLA